MRAICQAVQIPVVAIGGISADNMSALKGSGIIGVAVISAIFGQTDVKAAAEQLLCNCRHYRDKHRHCTSLAKMKQKQF